ncbi:MAG: lamin tail domain-containing protein [Ardenticatenales bacterium]|nr:lamin tail domain-containing protein [Ardenticatenales bacterium]
MRPTRTARPRRPAAARALAAAASLAVLGAAILPRNGASRRSTTYAQGPSATAMKICEIQGDGPSTMAPTSTLVTEGIVTAAFVRVEPFGFMIEDPGCDGRVETSDGVFVYVPKDVDVRAAVGQRVRVTGRAKEYQGLTELVVSGPTAVEVLGTAELPAPFPLTLSTNQDHNAALLEAHEGMRVALPPVAAVGGTDAHGEVALIDATAVISHVLRPAADPRLIAAVAPSGWPVVTQGDTLTGVVGPLHYWYGKYIVAVDDWSTVTVTAGGRRPAAFAPSAAGELTAATFNVENLFDGVDDPGKDDTEATYFPRSQAEYERLVDRRAKAVAERLGMPDIVSIEEIEHLSVLADLAANPRLAAADYGAALIEGIDPRGIDVGVLYNRSRLRLLGVEQRQKCMDGALAGPAGLSPCTLPGGAPGKQIFARPPLVVHLGIRGTDGRITVVANHFKSKGGDDGETTATRLLQAKHIVDLVRTYQAASPTTPVFVMGDLNDFEDSPPIQELVGTGLLTDLHDRVPAESDYTFIFNGTAQVLDYILVPPAFAADHVTDARVAHFNVDFPSHPPLDRRPEPPPFDTSRVSDHDPFVIRFKRFGAPRYELFLPALLRSAAFDAPHGGDGPTATARPFPPAATPTSAGQPTSPPGTPPTAVTTLEPTVAPPTATPAAGEVPRAPLRIATLFYDGVVRDTEADEYIEIENVTANAMALRGWTVVSARGTDQVFAFPAAAMIDAGARCRVYTNEDHPELPCAFKWGSDQGIWNNSGDKAELRDPAGTLIDHKCYGGAPWGFACAGAMETPPPTPMP